MATIRIGTVDIPPSVANHGGWEGFFKKLTYVELTGLVSAPVKASTLTKWATTAPERSLGLMAPSVLTDRNGASKIQGAWTVDAGSGDFRDSPAARAALEQFAAAAITVKAAAVIFSSPEMMSPSASNREQIKKFFTELAPAEKFGGASRVWIPSGLWTPLTAATFAADLGLVCAVDPLIQDPDMPIEAYAALPGDSVYYRPTGLGRSGPLSADRLDELVTLMGVRENATVAFATSERFRDATNLVKTILGNS